MILDSSSVVFRNQDGMHVLSLFNTYEIEVCKSSAGSEGIFTGRLEGIFTANRVPMIRIQDCDDESIKTCITIDSIVGIKVIDS